MTSSNKFLQLRITRAHITLLCLPVAPCGVRTVLLERIGALEIRMFETAGDAADAPLFWMELYDHERQSSLASCSCYGIEAAASAFEDFVFQANRDAERAEPDGAGPLH